MKNIARLLLCLTLVYHFKNVCAKKQPPHIIFILVDDWGWGDVGMHGAPFATPNIDELAYNGVIMNNYYVQQLCSPSRAALMTGRYPIHTGLQHFLIFASQPLGLGLNETIMPQYLQRLGYSSHIVGKWHLGFFTEDHTPHRRGFDSHFGYYTAHIDYYDRLLNEEPYWGYDLRRNGILDYSTYGHYGTELFTNEAIHIINDHATSSKPLFLYLGHQGVHAGNKFYPLQVPGRYLNKFEHMETRTRKLVAGMVSAVDDSIGLIVQTLKDNGMYDNSIIVVSTDNGGPTKGHEGHDASNWPLRGEKNTLWEGGIRGIAFIHSPLLEKRARVMNGLMHLTDWVPTLYHAAGGKMTDLPDNLDGFDMWDSLSRGTPSPRTELLHNIDPIFNTAALRVGNYKIVIGEEAGGDYDGWKNPDNLTTEKILNRINSTSTRALLIDCGPRPDNVLDSCTPTEAPCLFDISVDPCEYVNLADTHPEILQDLIVVLAKYNKTAVEPRYPPKDPTANPANHNGAWVPWINLSPDVDNKIHKSCP
ncbi:arylsulfatase I-like [Glandiceps talaboti]